MRQSWLGLFAVAIVLPSCGGSSPAAPTPSPSPVVVATPTPTPVPATTPAPSPIPEEGEPPVTNTNPARRLTMRIFVIENPDGTYTGNVDPKQPIPVGYTARLDVTAKDLDNRETVGQGEVQFFFSDPGLARVSGNHTNQRRVQGLGVGSMDCWAVQDGVTSNTITLTFVR
jgi:hypothetical protein